MHSDRLVLTAGLALICLTDTIYVDILDDTTQYCMG